MSKLKLLMMLIDTGETLYDVEVSMLSIDTDRHEIRCFKTLDLIQSPNTDWNLGLTRNAIDVGIRTQNHH